MSRIPRGRPSSTQDSQSLADSPATNAAHVRRVLGRLRAAELVRSQPGPRGGWMLERPAAEIDLGLVWLAVNDEDPVLGVHTPQPDCDVGRRVHRNLLDVLREDAATALVGS